MPRQGFQTPFRKETVRELALRAVEIARNGLSSRNVLDKAGNDETGFLTALHDRADTGMTPADHLLDDYANKWDGDIDRIWKDCAY